MPIRRRGALSRRHPQRRIVVPGGPEPLQPGHEPFEHLVERALDGLAPAFQQLLENVAIVVEDEPTPEQSRDAEGGLVGLYGLYEGTPVAEYASDLVPFPNKISLFRLALEEDFPDPIELAEEVRRTVVHELAHHAGIDDRRLRELGYE
jgi:predicted Zn-dependent protease with MMP-like domain